MILHVFFNFVDEFSLQAYSSVFVDGHVFTSWILYPCISHTLIKFGIIALSIFTSWIPQVLCVLLHAYHTPEVVVMQKPRNYRGVSLPDELVERVEQLIKKLGTYRTIAEFVSEAVRLRLEALEKHQKTEVQT